MTTQINVSRRKLLVGLLGGAGAGVAAGAFGALGWARQSDGFRAYLDTLDRAEAERFANRILPREGIELPIILGDSVVRLVEAGAIDQGKFEALYQRRGGLPQWVRDAMTRPSKERITFSPATAPYLLNLLWPLGIANKATFNEHSPLAKEDGARFASTGGWSLGTEHGYSYFNKVAAVEMSLEQQMTVLEAARKTFRPCCNNSTFFQDCNHGSAMLGLYELAAAQGLGTSDLLAAGKVANSYWYPSQYLAIARLFEDVKKTPWAKASPEMVLGEQYASATGWRQNVDAVLKAGGATGQRVRGGGGGCGV